MRRGLFSGIGYRVSGLEAGVWISIFSDEGKKMGGVLQDELRQFRIVRPICSTVHHLHCHIQGVQVARVSHATYVNRATRNFGV